MKRLIALGSAFSTLAAIGALSGACVGSDLDFYSEVFAECDYRTAKAEFRFDNPGETSLTPECKETLNLLLPYDETWLNAPEGLKDKVTEAFQVILAYPLALPPENRILGEVPWAIPAKALCMFAPELYEDCPSPHEKTAHPNISRNVFNYLMSRIERITYIEPNDRTGQSASLTPDLLRTHGQGYLLSITDGFWTGSNDFLMTPFRRAAIMVHEAWHGDSRTHTLCSDDDAGSGFACDADLTGSYGIETVYALALLHGSFHLTRKVEPESPEAGFGDLLDVDLDGDGKGDAQKEEYVLSSLDVVFLAYDICLNLKKVKSMRYLVDDVSCASVTGRWLLEQEGLERPRLD